jgi:hypothetical protein
VSYFNDDWRLIELMESRRAVEDPFKGINKLRNYYIST